MFSCPYVSIHLTVFMTDDEICKGTIEPTYSEIEHK